jgi:uncharacterized protein YbaA (DUF1428 family)
MKKANYVDGFVTPVPKAKVAAYKKMSTVMGKCFRKHVALAYVESMADDVAKGKVTSFPRSVKLKPSEVVAFAFITFRSKGDRVKIWKKVFADPSMAMFMDPKKMPFDGKRMYWGGFKPIVKLG